MILQTFAKIHWNANHWAAVEVEWVDNPELTQKYEDRTVTVMNSYGTLSNISYSELSFHFQDSYTFTSEPLILQMKESHFRNVLTHYKNTKENIFRHTLHVPMSFISIKSACGAYWNVIEEALKKLEDNNDTEAAYQTISEMVTSYKYRLGWIKVVIA